MALISLETVTKKEQWGVVGNYWYSVCLLAMLTRFLLLRSGWLHTNKHVCGGMVPTGYTS